MWLLVLIWCVSIGYAAIDGYSQNPQLFMIFILGWFGFYYVSKRLDKLEEASADAKESVSKLEKRISWLEDQD